MDFAGMNSSWLKEAGHFWRKGWILSSFKDSRTGFFANS